MEHPPPPSPHQPPPGPGMPPTGFEGNPQLGATKIGAPATALMITGIIMLVGTLLNAWGATPAGQNAIMGTMGSMMSSLGPEAEEAFRQAYEQQRAAQGGANVIVNIFSLGAAFIVSVLCIAGAHNMKRLTAWPLCLTASILAIQPCFNGCCCVGMPFGIWALVVLLNKDVKAAFAATRQQPLHG